MKDEWLLPYVHQVGGERIMLPGNNSCSKNIKVALEFAVPKELKEGYTPTLFVIAIRNYSSFNGVALSNEAYTAYPNEAEVLLTDGCSMYVLAIDTGVKIENTTKGQIAAYNGHALTVV